MESEASTGTGLLVVIAVFYMFPWFVAKLRGTSNSGGVFIINVFLGWTFLGWIIALAMAAGGRNN